MPKRFRKKPVEVIAIKFATNNEIADTNMNEIVRWINQGKSAADNHAWHNGTNIFIMTLEGTMTAQCGDWIVKGVANEFYPCKPDIFEKTYEEIT